jgi:hypothetical protein
MASSMAPCGEPSPTGRARAVAAKLLFLTELESADENRPRMRHKGDKCVRLNRENAQEIEIDLRMSLTTGSVRTRRPNEPNTT